MWLFVSVSCEISWIHSKEFNAYNSCEGHTNSKIIIIRSYIGGKELQKQLWAFALVQGRLVIF